MEGDALRTSQVAEAWITAVVIRADGTVEDLGQLDSYRRPWYRTLLRKVAWWRQ